THWAITLVANLHGDMLISSFFFFQAEDGIRDLIVTGVQTCALPISRRGPFAIADKIRAGKDEATVVARDDVAEPFRARLGADEDEKTAGGQLFGFAGRAAQNGDAAEARVAVNAHDARPRPHLDLGSLFDLLDQVVRHGAG